MIRITGKGTIRMERQRMMNKMDNFVSFIVNRRERERERGKDKLRSVYETG